MKIEMRGHDNRIECAVFLPAASILAFGNSLHSLVSWRPLPSEPAHLNLGIDCVSSHFSTLNRGTPQSNTADVVAIRGTDQVRRALGLGRRCQFSITPSRGQVLVPVRLSGWRLVLYHSARFLTCSAHTLSVDCPSCSHLCVLLTSYHRSRGHMCIWLTIRCNLRFLFVLWFGRHNRVTKCPRRQERTGLSSS